MYMVRNNICFQKYMYICIQICISKYATFVVFDFVIKYVFARTTHVSVFVLCIAKLKLLKLTTHKIFQTLVAPGDMLL